MTAEILAAARQYVQRGISVIPINPINHSHPKRPAIGSWKRYQLAPPSEGEIQKWWGNGSKNRLAIVTGGVSHGLCVFDIDNLDLAKDVLRDRDFMADKTAVRTPSGGLHLYFRERRESKGLVKFLGVGDLRAWHNYVGAPPSEGYEWVKRGKLLVVENLADWVQDEFMPYFGLEVSEEEAKKSGYALPDEVVEGQRNDTMFRLASYMRGKGLSKESILAALRVENRERCKPPLEDEEIEKIAESAGRYDANRAEISEKPTAVEIRRVLQSIKRIGVLGDYGGPLYVYDGGVYRKGETSIKQTMVDLLEEKYTLQRASLVFDELAYSQETTLLPQQPPLDKLNLLNGILDLETMELGVHTSDFLSPVQLPIKYDPSARCPEIQKFLRSVLPEDMIEVFYEVAGWLLVPDTSRKTAVLFVGPTDTGKSTAIELLQGLLGNENYSSISLQDLSSTFRPAQLVGKLANFFDDLPNTSLKESGTFKVLTGRGTLTVERKYGQPFEVKPFARLVFAANDHPPSSDTSDAFFNRWLVFSFDKRIPKNKQIPNFAQRLMSEKELSGLLNLAIRALKRGKFSETESAEKAVRKYQANVDPIAAFVAERVTFESDQWMRQRDLALAYRSWCTVNRKASFTSQEFNEHLRTLDEWRSLTVRSAMRDGWPIWRGLRLKHARE